MSTVACMQIREELLPGVFVVACAHHPDLRGSLTKLFHSESLKSQGIDFLPAESFITRSSTGVLRGMHFQTGEAAHNKLIYCLKGSVLDVVVDICPESSNFNRPVSIELNAAEPVALLIRKGYAHGFLSLQEDSWMLYSTSTVHCPKRDCGVIWSSIDFDWPIKKPLLSERDKAHPSIHNWR